MFCEKCGYQIQGFSKFCPKCGASLADQGFTQPAQGQNTGNNNFVNNTAPANNAYNPAQAPANNAYNPAQAPANNNYNPAQDPYSYRYQPQQQNFRPQAAAKPLSPPVKTKPVQRVFSIILSILIFSITTSIAFIVISRATFSSKSVKDASKSGQISDITITENGKEKKLAEYLLGNINKDVVRDYKIDEKKIKTILNSSEVKSIITDLTVDYTQLFVYGKDSAYLNEDSIMKDIQSVDQVVYKNTGYRFSSKDYSDIRKDLQNGGKYSFLTESGLKNDVFKGADPKVFSLLFSIPLLIILIIIDLGLIFVIFLINKWKLKLPFTVLGISFMAFGFITLCYSLVAFILSSVFNIYIVSGLITSAAVGNLIFGLVFLALGVVMFILSIKFRKRDNLALKQFKEQQGA